MSRKQALGLLALGHATRPLLRSGLRFGSQRFAVENPLDSALPSNSPPVLFLK